MGKKAKKEARVRVAFVGAGNRAMRAHYPSLAANPNVEIAAVSELDRERLNRACGEYDIRGRYTSFIEMIEKERPDGVYAIMPPQHLYDVAATVLSMGCNLFVEKPPALTTEQTRQMAILARKNKVLTGVTFQRRFAPVIRQGKAICETRGPIHTADATFIKYAVGGGPVLKGAIDYLTADGIHAVDTLRYLCGGDVIGVASDVRREGAEHHTIHLALVKFSSGATGTLRSGYMMGRRIFSVEAHAPGISLFGDPEEGGRIFADGKVAPVQELDPFALCGSRDEYRAFGPYDMHQHFAECVRTGKQPETNFDDAIKTMELVDAIYRNQI